MSSYCYDCGRSRFEGHSGDEGDGRGALLSCEHCWELVFEADKIGPLRALVRRALYRWHSNTEDPAARGWRRRKHRPAPWT